MPGRSSKTHIGIEIQALDTKYHLYLAAHAHLKFSYI